jgi:methylated-DNA-[protein]-cysteine S-methyltransferase
MSLVTCTFDAPIGPLRLFARGDSLVALDLPNADHRDGEPGDVPALAETRAQLAAYFAGTLTDFDLPLAPAGTVFQRAVWDQLLQIPYATTWSYGQLAARLGKPHASRAVGMANGRNPIAIIIPCHRVIGADGTLTGYGGGLPTKRWLLDHEYRIQRPSSRSEGLFP